MNAFDDLIPAGQPGAFDDLVPQKAVAEGLPPGRTVLGTLGDVGVTALKGAVGLPQAFMGIADLVSGGQAGKDFEDAGLRFKDAQGILSGMYSPAQQAANRKVQQADGFVDTLKTALENPSVIATTVGESLPQMLGGAAIARGGLALTGKLAPWAAGAIGEGVMGAGSAAEQIRSQSADGLITGKQTAAAIASGVGTAAIGGAAGKFAGSKVGQKLGLSDIDTMLAAGKFSKTPGGFIKQVVGSGISEGVLEELPQSVQEQMWQNYAQDKPLTEGVGNAAALGLLSGAAMGGAGGGFNAAQASLLKNPAEVVPAPAPGPNGDKGLTADVTYQNAGGKTVISTGSAPSSVATANTDQAEAALRTPVSLTALDRANEIDSSTSKLQERLGELSSENGYGPTFDEERQNLAGEVAQLQQERDAIAATWPASIAGAPTQFSTESGAKLDGQYALMDAGDLVTSHTESLAPNPLYPKELQPRDRSRNASEIQVASIVQKLDPARLGVSADAATGAPIVGADGLVESGNARTIAMKRVYQANGQKAADYQAWLRENAQQFGLDPAALDGMAQPVLVRVRSTPVNRAEFARQANASTVQRMSPSEQALTDAKRMTSLEGLNPDEDGNFGNNMDFVRQFMGTLPITEQSDLIESDGRLSTAGYRRMQNAVLARAYGDSPSLRRMTESMDNNLLNISKALVRVAPTIAAARERMDAGTLHQADIAPDLLAAVEGLSALKEKGWTAAQELAQVDLTGPKYSPEAAQVLTFLSDNARSPRRIADYFQRYYEALEQAGNPAQPSMFGDEGPAPTRAGLLSAARGEPAALSPAPAPAPSFDFSAVEQSLTAERDATNNEIEDGWIQGGERRRQTRVERAVEAAVNSVALDAENARGIVDIAIAAGRLDLAEYAVHRAENYARKLSTTPGVSKDSPKYEAIKQDLDRRKAEAVEQAAELRRNLNEQKKQQGEQTNANADQNTQRGIAGEGAQTDARDGGQPQDAPGNARSNEGNAAGQVDPNGRPSAQPGREGTTSEATSDAKDGWVSFPADSGTLGIPRRDMPQIKGEHRGAMVNFLAARGIENTKGTISPDKLKATQAEFSSAKVARIAKSGNMGDRSILISSDNHVLDGHHQWMAHQSAGTDAPFIRFNAPIGELLAAVREFPSVGQSEGTKDAASTVVTQQEPVEEATASATQKPAKDVPPTVGDAVVWSVNGQELTGEVVRAANKGGALSVRATSGVSAGGVFNVPASRAKKTPALETKAQVATEKIATTQSKAAPTTEPLTQRSADATKPEQDKPAQSGVLSTTAAKPAQSLSVKRAQDVADSVLDHLGIGAIAGLQVVREPGIAGFDVPASVVPQGATRDGKIYLFAENLSDEAEAFKVVVHEVFHLGLSKSVEQGAYIQTMLRFLSDPLVREYAQRWKASEDGVARKTSMPVNNWQALAVEEALADIAEEMNTERGDSGTRKGWTARMARALADLAVRAGLPGVANKIRALTRTEAESFVQAVMQRASDTGPVMLRDTRFASARSDQTQTEAFKKWFTGSKVVDADGKPLVVYHGTNADFSVFDQDEVGSNFGRDKDGFFFTASTIEASGYADSRSQFLAAGMSDSRKIEPKQGANVVPAYLSLQNPLTLEKQTWAVSSSPEAEIDEQGISLIDYFDEFNSSIIDYAKTSGHDGVLFQHNGKTLAIAFSPEQIKSATGNTGAFDPANPDIRFSRAKGKGAEAEPLDLMIAHSLSADNLLHAVRMGGIAVPSLAVTRKDQAINGFGEITLLGSKALADPKGYASTKVFGADIYSPRYPTTTFEFTPTMRKRGEAALSEGIAATEQKYVDWSEVESNGARQLARQPATMWQFLKERGMDAAVVRTEPKALPKEFEGFKNDTRHAHELTSDPAFIAAAWKAHEAMLTDAYDGDKLAAQEELAAAKARAAERGTSSVVDSYARGVAQYQRDLRQSGAIDQSATRSKLEDTVRQAKLDDELTAYAAGLMDDLGPNERIPQGFTSSGKRKYLPHTLDNVVKLLKKELRGGEGFNYGVGSLRAKFTPQFKSIADIRKAKDRLISEADFDKIKGEINDEFSTIADRLKIRTDTLGAIMEDAIKMGVTRAAAEYQVDLSDESAQQIAEFMTRLRNLPTAYFEAKVLREVSLSEFSGAVVPQGVSQKVLDALKAAGVTRIGTYAKGDESSRKTAVATLADTLHAEKGDVLFSMAGQNAATADTHALATAQQRLDAGDDAETVRQDTGWHKGADGKWRFEISDSDADLKIKARKGSPLTPEVNRWMQENGRTVTVGDLLDHSSLFAAYPSIRDIGVSFGPSEQAVGGGRGLLRGNRIWLADDMGNNETLNVLLHEIQHGIQHIEGFAMGGSPRQFRDKSADRSALEDGAILARMAMSAGSVDAAIDMFKLLLKREPVPGAESAALSGESPDSLQARAKKMLTQHEQYKQLAGEVEARNTQARQGMTAAQRKATAPEATADVPASDVIVTFNGKEMAEAPAPANAASTLMDAPAKTTQVAEVRAAITKAYGSLLDKLEKKGLVVLVQSEAEAIRVTAKLRAQKKGTSIEDETARLTILFNGPAAVPVSGGDIDIKRSTEGEVQGFFDQVAGKAVLIADGLTAQSAGPVLMHEVGIHMASDGTLKPLFDRAAGLLRIRPKSEFLNRVRERMASAGEKSGEEAAAYITEEYERDRASAPATVTKWIDDLTAAVRAWLFRRGVVLKAGQLTVADIAAVARANARSLAAGRRGSNAARPAFVPAFSIERDAGERGADAVQVQPTAADRAQAIIEQKVAGGAPMDAIGRAITQATGIERLTSASYEKIGFFLDRMTPERIKAGIISDYGVPEAVIDRRTLLQSHQRVRLRKAGTLIEKLATLTRAESRVAYEWMNMDGADPKAYLSKMEGLPEESVKVLQEVQQMIDKLSQEAVELGQLDPEAFKRNRFAYLRRSYAKHILEQTSGDKAKRSRTISVLGEQYKGRGMSEAVPMDRMQAVKPEWWGRKLAGGNADTALKGEKFIRLERRAPSGEGTTPIEGMEGKATGKLLQVTYWPADEPIPGRYAEWRREGTWEVRDTKGGNVVLWRDFTKDEREKMGEVDEARFAIAKTLHAMIHDVETGRYLEWLAHTQAKKEGDTIPGTVVEASERMRDTFAKDEWVRVPDSKIQGTNVFKYGKLAGRYLPGPVWNDLRQVVGGRFQPFGETYSKILGMWKVSKTALSPAVHMNNVMSNFVMADWHDVRALHISKALRVLLAAADKKGGIADREAAKAVLARYSDSGGDAGSFVTQEISRDQIEPLLASLEKELAQDGGGSTEAQTGVFAALQHALHLRFPEAWDAGVNGKVGKGVGSAGAALLDLYQAEDDVFRLAAWFAAKEEGATDLQAGKRARKSFLDYSINAPWINAMRQSAWPFLSFTYRAVPMLLETAARKPHKLVKLMAVAGGLNALGAMLAGGGDAEDKERKLLPEEKAGSIWGIVPKLIRMPWNDDHGSPVYLDIRRWIPVGDVFDVGQGHSAIPVLPGLMPGGPLVLMGEVVLNRSAFTGKPITLETDTPAQQAAKVGDFLYKAFTPNILGLPGTYATTGVVESMTGRTDAFGREMSTAQAAASSFGVKLSSYPADVMRRNVMASTLAQASEIDKGISQLKRQRQTGRIDDAEFQDQVRTEQEKKIKLMRKMGEKLN